MSGPREPLSRDEARQLLSEVLSCSAAEATEVRLDAADEQLTRFAENQIHQHVGTRDHVVTIRAFAGTRGGTASTNRLDSASLRQTAERALTQARLSPGGEPWPAPVEAAEIRPLEALCAASVCSAPEERADALAPLLADAAARGLEAAGALSAETLVTSIATSNGAFAYHAGSHARFTCTARGADSSGWVSRHRRDVRELGVRELGTVAIEKAERSRSPVEVEPGPWTVVLEPAAVAELVAFLGPLGLGARSLEEGRSFLAGRMGERVTGDAVTLADDARDPRGFGRPFDDEATPRSSLTLIERGIARAVVHDRRTAARAGVASTGHAVALGLSDGPQPWDLVLATGKSSMEDMIAGTERGLLVTRFWYNRVVDARRTIVTGMTRDGTFLIERGRIAGGVRNMRFNESVLGALERADAFGVIAEPTVFDWSGACVVAPAVRVREFTFSSVSPF